MMGVDVRGSTRRGFQCSFADMAKVYHQRPDWVSTSNQLNILCQAVLRMLVMLQDGIYAAQCHS
jgi:hypothetical protein